MKQQNTAVSIFSDGNVRMKVFLGIKNVAAAPRIDIPFIGDRAEPERGKPFAKHGGFEHKSLFAIRVVKKIVNSPADIARAVKPRSARTAAGAEIIVGAAAFEKTFPARRSAG